MRHYVAVFDAVTRKWFYANEGVDRKGRAGWTPAGACGKRMLCQDCQHLMALSPEQRACATCGGAGLVDRPEPCRGHDTAEEAHEHERQRVLSEGLRFWPDSPKADTQHRCQHPGCGAWTSGGGRAGYMRTFSLCEVHRTREGIEPLVQIGESWES